MYFRTVIFGALALALATPALAEPAAVAAAVANSDRGEADTALDESREPVRVLEFLGLESGDVALDIFAGGGYYSELMARAVGPDGFVLAQNPPSAIERFELAPVYAQRGFGERIANAAQFKLAFDDFVLPPESIDFALFHMVFHDLWFVQEPQLPAIDRDRFLSRLYQSMRLGGIVGIVDHVGHAGMDPAEEVAARHRIDPAVIRTAMEDAGFVLEEESDILRNPEDDHETSVFDPAIRGHTDRIVYRFRKPGDGG